MRVPYASRMSTQANITVYGVAQSAGSKRGFVNPKNGRVIITDDNSKSKDWKGQVAQAAGEQYDGGLMEGALILGLTFYVPRPKGHYGSGKNAAVVKASSPQYPTGRPDATKLTRGVEDALTGILWRDDAQVVDQHVRKRYGTPARCEITVTVKERQVVGDADPEQPSLLAAA